MKRFLSILVTIAIFTSISSLHAQDEAVAQDVMVEEVMADEPAEANFTQELKATLLE